jgi:3-oxoacyl-[acyl-carrier protein] reductase
MSHNAHRNLEGKVAIVTGSSQGIGAAIAKQLAAEGATVAVNYFRVRYSNVKVAAHCNTPVDAVQGAETAKAVVESIEKAGGKAFAFQGDVAVRAQVFDLVDQVVKKWGRLDIFVNNAGIVNTHGPLGDVGEEQVERQLAVNLKGTLWGIQAAAEVIQSGGSIINLSSIVARMCWPVRPSPCTCA